MKIFTKLLTVFLTLALFCSVVVANAAFDDVPSGAWYEDAVNWCQENGIMGGTSETAAIFEPDTTMSRAMLATVLYRQSGSPAAGTGPAFSDWTRGTWYSDAVVWAAGEGVITGYDNGLFGVNDPVTREQLATILWRYAGRPSAGNGAAFADESDIADYAAQAVDWAQSNNIMTGMDNNRFNPRSGATRAQIATILYRWLSAQDGTESTPTPTPNGGETTNSGHVLVAYFSRADENYSVGVIEKGNTAIVAELIAEQTGADLFEIVPVNAYPAGYEEMKVVATQEQNSNARPEIANAVENWDDYDVVFLGYPIWYGDMPMIVYNFLESYDFSGKTVVPFNTHEGSGQSGTQSRIASTIPGATVLNGLAIRGATAQNDASATRSAVETWIERDLKDVLPEKEPAATTPATPETAAVGKFDLEKGTVLLNNGIEMPILGIGTFTLTNEQASDSVFWALSDGYHLIDTATAYNNEEGVGEGIRRAIEAGAVKREDIFLTTKLWPSAYTMEGIDASLERLGVDYIDLLLLHQPIGDYIGGYQAMEQAVAEGKVRAIGLSNFRPNLFNEIMEIATIAPAVNQVETHPYYQEVEMIEYLKQYGTVLEAWYPLGGRGNTQTMFADETISAIAAAHGKTSAQIILRWHLQAGHIAIPGSNNPDHILENISIFDFELTDAEMAAMTAIDRNDPFFGGFGNQDELEDAADRWGLDNN